MPVNCIKNVTRWGIKPNVLYRLYGTSHAQSVQKKSYVPIANFYAGKSVFITGGTGFLGKVFIEKLLYSCKQIDKVYVLVRAPNVQAARDRIQQFVDKPLFTRLKDVRPEDLKKIVPIVGDLTKPDLGISSEDAQTLTDNVSIVFHSGATINFNEPLKSAVKINIEGTKSMLELSKKMKNMKAFVYISTAFTNTDRDAIDEMLYPPPASLQEVYQFLNKHGDDKEKTRHFLGLNGRPNTYTFTKAIAENIVGENHGAIPAVVVRPSAVTASINEPLKGWIDSWSLQSLLTASAALGRSRIIIGDNENIVDFIPVDYVVNFSIIAATICDKAKDMPVYHCCTSDCNPLTLQYLFLMLARLGRKHKINDMIYPAVLVTRSPRLTSFILSTMQTFPAYVADGIMKVLGKEPNYVAYDKKLNKIRQSFQFFTCYTWKMNADKARTLIKTLTPADRIEFPCDPKHIIWKNYLSLKLRGMVKYLFEQKN